MILQSLSPLPAVTFPWQLMPGSWNLTLVIKASYTLLPGESVLAEDQDPPNEHDGYWDDDPMRSLREPSDYAPRKSRADVIVVGRAYAPRGGRARSMRARLAVGGVDKSVEVHGDRWISLDAEVIEGGGFVSMPLRYERASAGAEEDPPNPVGTTFARDARGRIALPNLQPPGLHVTAATTSVPLAGFGPLAPHWRERAARLGPHASAMLRDDWRQRPLPPDLDFGFFNSAPVDQQGDWIRPDETIVLEGLHREHERLVTRLPGIRPRAVAVRSGSAQEVELVADTLLIDTSRGIATVVWRGRLHVESPDAPGSLVVVQEAGTATLTTAEIARLAMGHGATLAQRSSATMWLDDADLSPSLSNGRADGCGTLMILPEDPVPAAGLPFLPIPRAPAFVSPSPHSGVPIHSLSAPAAPPPRMFSAPADESPWAGGVAPRSAPVEPSDPVSIDAFIPERNASGRRAEGPAGVAETLKLLWHDPDLPPRLHEHGPFQLVLAQHEFARVDAKSRARSESDAEISRAEVFDLLARGETLGLYGLDEVMRDAVDEDGKLTPSLVLVAGDLRLPFDEVAELKATVTAVRPFAGGEPRLLEKTEHIEELLKTPWLEGAGGVARTLTESLVDAFAQARPKVEPGYLERHTERLLLSRRAYQERDLYGKKWVRALLSLGAGEPLPAYLPAEAAGLLPLYKTFRGRLLGELDLREEEAEAHPYVLRILAIGRAVSK